MYKHILLRRRTFGMTLKTHTSCTTETSNDYTEKINILQFEPCDLYLVDSNPASASVTLQWYIKFENEKITNSGDLC